MKDLDDMISKHKMAIIYYYDDMLATMHNILSASIYQVIVYSSQMVKERLEATIKASSCLIHHQVHKVAHRLEKCSGNLSAWSESIEILSCPWAKDNQIL